MNRSVILGAAATVVLLAAVGIDGAAAQGAGLTIYQDGRVLVRRTVTAEVPRGKSTHLLELGELHAGSVISIDPDVTFTEAHYADGRDEVAALRRGIGRTFLVLTETDTVEVALLGVEPLRFRWPSGEITYGVPGGRTLFPPDLIPETPLLTLTVDARRDRPSLGLAYLRDGATWSASYSVVFDDHQARMSGVANIISDDIGLADAEVQLMAGAISRPGGREEFAASRSTLLAMEAAGEMRAQQVGDTHLYALPQAVSLVPGEATSVSLFPPTSTKYRRRYVIQGRLPWYGPIRSEGTTELAVRVRYDVERPHDGELGARAIPGGIVRMYRPDDEERLQLIGETTVGHTPAGKALDLDAGLAFDLTGEHTMTAYREEREDKRVVVLATYRVVLANGGDTAVTVEMIERRRGEWSVFDSSIPSETLSATAVRFAVSVPARGTAEFTYGVRAYQ